MGHGALQRFMRAPVRFALLIPQLPWQVYLYSVFALLFIIIMEDLYCKTGSTMQYLLKSRTKYKCLTAVMPDVIP